MKKGLFDIRIKFDGIPIIDQNCKTTEELDDAMRLVKRKMGAK